MLAISIVTVIIVMILLLVLVVPRIPSVPLSSLPPSPDTRQQILRMERNFKVLVSTSIVAMGIVFGAFPCTRFLRN